MADSSTLGDESQRPVGNAVIETLENDKLAVLNRSTCATALSMQSFCSTEYQHTDGIQTSSPAVERAFESIGVEASPSGPPINTLMQQDRQFLQVDTICENGDIYLTSTEHQPITYMVSNPELAVPSTSQVTVQQETDAKDEQVLEPAGILGSYSCLSCLNIVA
ncbi:uncharacterized protein [Watersipora subatra]|uniref:uncharacterized protein n=1 Tax=Watersipora subatra TaxID=2589382 RepID=UPI00355B8B14